MLGAGPGAESWQQSPTGPVSSFWPSSYSGEPWAAFSSDWCPPLPGRPQPVRSMTPGPKLQGPGFRAGCGHAWPSGTAPTEGQERIDTPSALTPGKNKGSCLLSDEGWPGTRGGSGGSSPSWIKVWVLFFVFNFQMNNSVAMPRLKYFSVFSKMWEKEMNFNEMFWFTLSKASSIVGFPRPKQMSAVSSFRLQKAEKSHCDCPAYPVYAPISQTRRATCKHQAGRTLKQRELKKTKIASGYNVFTEINQLVSRGGRQIPVPYSLGLTPLSCQGGQALADAQDLWADCSQEGLKHQTILKIGFKGRRRDVVRSLWRKQSRQVEVTSQTERNMPRHEAICHCGLRTCL